MPLQYFIFIVLMQIVATLGTDGVVTIYEDMLIVVL